MSRRVEELREKYKALAHAMQSGVAMKMNLNNSETTPKHLRVGVNAAMVDGSALSRLLVKKGVFTEEEFYESLVASMQEEVDRYEAYLSEHLGKEITLA